MVDYRLAGTSSIDVIAYDRGTYTQDFKRTSQHRFAESVGAGPISLGSSSIQAQGMLGWSIGRFGGTSSNVLFAAGNVMAVLGRSIALEARQPPNDRSGVWPPVALLEASCQLDQSIWIGDR